MKPIQIRTINETNVSCLEKNRCCACVNHTLGQTVIQRPELQRSTKHSIFTGFAQRAGKFDDTQVGIPIKSTYLSSRI